jgi:benzoyl-CoA reductase/2-hydroxyglutaryl-CoA dehydratase subunit BcrC/BadD/HgdB
LAVSSHEKIADEEFAGSSSGVAYFESCLGTQQTVEWLRKEKDSGRKVIGLLSAGPAAEIVLAAGAVPVRLVGIGEGKKACRDLPRDICPVAEASFVEAALLAEEGVLDAVVVPATCDWKRKLAELLRPVVQVLTLEPPVSESPEFGEADLRRFARELALITDLPVVRRNLQSASEEMAKAREALAALQQFQWQSASALFGPQALAVEESFLKDDLRRWRDHCRSFAEALTSGSAVEDAGDKWNGPRILLVGSPVMFRNRSAVHLIEEAGGSVVGDDFNGHLSICHHRGASAGENKAGFSALAGQWARTAFCSLVGEDDGLIFRAIDEFRVEGIVLHTYRTCARLQMRAPAFLRRAAERGIPVLALETEGDDSDTERLLVRIEPFIETLLAGRRQREPRSWR